MAQAQEQDTRPPELVTQPGEPEAYAAPAAGPEAEPAFAETPPEVQTEPQLAPADVRRTRQVVLGVLKALDRGLSFLLRIPMSEPAELDEFAALITPAAELHGEKLGPRFWTIAAAVGFAGFILGKLAQAAVSRKRPAPAKSEETDTEVKGQGGARKLGADPIYPGDHS